MQCHYCGTELPITSKAIYGTPSNRAEPTRSRTPASTGPYRAVSIFQKTVNKFSLKPRISSKFVIVPTRKAFASANPNRPISGNQQADNAVGRQLRVSGWAPLNGSHAIKAIQTEFGT